LELVEASTLLEELVVEILLRNFILPRRAQFDAPFKDRSLKARRFS
jgi:hypothetical protein